MPRRAAALVTALAVALGAAACSGERPSLADGPPVTTAGSTSTSTTTTVAPSTTAAPTTAATTTEPRLGEPPYLVATARDGLGSVPVFDVPESPEPNPDLSLDNPNEYGRPQVMLVTSQEDGWVEVRLPIRPNGTTGWVRESDVTVAPHDYRIEVSLGEHRLQLFRGDEQVMDVPVGVGTGEWPTPPGVYYLWQLIRPTNESNAYGPYAYALSGFSDTLFEFAGGPGRLAIHGTNDESTVGSDVSHGCMRLRNADITRMAEEIGLPHGVPVLVRA